MAVMTSDLLDFILNLLRDPEAAAAFQDDPEAALAEAGLSDVSCDDIDAVMPVVLDYAPVTSMSSFDRAYETGADVNTSWGDVGTVTGGMGLADGGMGGGGDDGSGGTGGGGYDGGGGHDDKDGGGTGGGGYDGGGGHDDKDGGGYDGGGGHDDKDDKDGGGHDGKDEDHDDKGGGGHDDVDDHAHAVQQLHHVVNNFSYTTVVDDRDTITDQSVNQNIWAEGDVSQMFDNDAIVASGTAPWPPVTTG